MTRACPTQARHAQARPDAAALIQGESVITWRALHARSERLAGALASAGIAKGDVVYNLLRNIQMGNTP